MPRGVPKQPAGGLTKAGKPRQRKEGAGAPRTISQPDDDSVKISPRIPASQKQWLERQPGGINATIRRLIEEEIKRAAQTT